jgi:hypothetical protein
VGARGSSGVTTSALATVRSSAGTSREIGNRREEAFALLNLAELELEAGRLDDAWSDAELGRELFQEVGSPRGELIALGVLGDVAAEAGDLERLQALAAVALELSDGSGISFQRSNVAAYAGWAALARGDADEAERRFADAHVAGYALEVASSGAIEVFAREWARDAEGLRGSPSASSATSRGAGVLARGAVRPRAGRPARGRRRVGARGGVVGDRPRPCGIRAPHRMARAPRRGMALELLGHPRRRVTPTRGDDRPRRGRARVGRPGDAFPRVRRRRAARLRKDAPGLPRAASRR